MKKYSKSNGEDTQFINKLSYPNPANNSFRLDTDELICYLETLAIYSCNGKRFECDTKKNLGSIEIDISNLDSGVYFGKLECGEKQIQFTFVKQ